MRLSHALTSSETTSLQESSCSGSAQQEEANKSIGIEQEVLAAYDQFAGALLRYARALGKDADLAQDAVQEAFLRFYIALLNGETIHYRRAWVYRVTRNYVLDRLKEYSYRNCISLDAKEIAGLDDRIMIEDQSWTEKLIDVLRQLTPRELECVRLRIEGLKNREIAEVLNLSLGTVCTLLARGLHRIRKAYDRSFEDKKTTDRYRSCR
jgi:RNA polymerase sigma factor (sigma-70 family)